MITEDTIKVLIEEIEELSSSARQRANDLQREDALRAYSRGYADALDGCIHRVRQSLGWFS